MIDVNNINILISLDPSFTRTGICITDLQNKTIDFYTASEKIGEKQFENVVKAAKSIVNQLKNIFSKYASYSLISESPLPCSSMSSALYSLDTLIYTTFEDHILKTYNPAILRSRIHQRKYDKNDSIALAERYMKILSDKGYTIKSNIKHSRKIPHDCCESLLYLHLFLKDLGHPDFQFDNSDMVAAYKQRMKNLKQKEKELLSNKEI